MPDKPTDGTPDSSDVAANRASQTTPPPIPGAPRPDSMSDDAFDELLETAEEALEGLNGEDPVVELSPDDELVPLSDDDLEELPDEELLEQVAAKSVEPQAGGEMARLQAMVDFLNQAVEEVPEGRVSALLRADLSVALQWLGYVVGSLEQARLAFKEDASLLVVAWSYLSAAYRAESDEDIVVALEAMSRLLEDPVDRAAAEMTRAGMLEAQGDEEAAAASYRRAVSESKSLMAAARLERLAARRGDADEVVRALEAQLEACSDGRLGDELGGRLLAHYADANRFEDVQSLAGTRGLTASASALGAYSFLRMHTKAKAHEKIIDVRKDQASAGFVDKSAALFDIGMIREYVFDDPEGAMTAFEQAAQCASGPSKAVILEELIELYELHERWAEAADSLTFLLEIVEEKGTRARFWCKLAENRLRLGDEPGASEAFGEAISADATWSPALEGGGRLFGRMGDRDQLVAMHRRESESAVGERDRAHALRRLGELLIEDPETLSAGIAALRQASEHMPGDLGVFLVLERLLRKEGGWQDLDALYERALEAADDRAWQAWLLTQRAEVLVQHLDGAAKAIDCLQRALELGGEGPPPTLARLAVLLENEKEWERLIDVLQQLIAATDAGGLRASFFDRLAQAYGCLGRNDEALSAYRSAIEIAPTSHPVHRSAGRAFGAAGQHEALVELFETAGHSGSPAERSKWLARAGEVTATKLENETRAAEFFTQALDVDPSNRRARDALSSLVWGKKKWSLLRSLLDESTPVSLVRGAALAEVEDDLKEAARLYKLALDKGVVAVRAAYLRIVAELGDWASFLDVAAQDATPAEQLIAGHVARAQERDDYWKLWLDASKAPEDGAARAARLALLSSVDALESADASELVSGLTGVFEDPAFDSYLGLLRADVGGEESAPGAPAAAPSDAVSLLAAGIRLESQGRRVERTELYVKALQQLGSGDLASCYHRAVAVSLEELGMLVDATHSWERGLYSEHEKSVSVTASMRLAHLYAELEDMRNLEDAVARLAEAMPASSCAAAAWRALSEVRSKNSDVEGAKQALVSALKHDALDYEALQGLVALCEQTSDDETVIAPLLGAFEKEKDTDSLRYLGFALVDRMRRCGRDEKAAEVADKLLAAVPEDAMVRLLAAESLFHRGDQVRALELLDALANAEEGPKEVRVDALHRLVAGLIRNGVPDTEKAKGYAGKLVQLDGSRAALHAAAELYLAAGDDEAAAEQLGEIARSEDLEAGERSSYLLVQAGLYETQIGDSTRALDVLSKVAELGQAPQAIDRVLALGDKTGRWDLVATSLSSALDADYAIKPKWEVGLRHRLAQILSDELGRPEVALRQYERILEIEPEDAEALERLAQATAAANPAKAVEYTRAIIAKNPSDVAALRRLRGLYLATDEADGAFLVEALLVGLGQAGEEEEYFYRQRRARLATGIGGKLEPGEIEVLFPLWNTPVNRLLGALEPVMAKVFPEDFAAYGLDPGSLPQPGQIGNLAVSMSRLFGTGDFRTAPIPTRLSPCAALDGSPILLLPRDLEESMQREQAFVIGALLARVAFHGAVCDPASQSPVTAKQLDYLIDAAFEIGRDDYDSPNRDSMIFKDIKSHLEKALTVAQRSLLREIVVELERHDPALSGAGLLDQIQLATARAAWLCGLDPALAIESFRRLAAMFGPKGDDGLPVALHQTLSFVLSAEHLALRKRLAVGVTQ